MQLPPNQYNSPNFGLGPNDNMNMFTSMMNNMMNLNRMNNDNSNNNSNNNMMFYFYQMMMRMQNNMNNMTNMNNMNNINNMNNTMRMNENSMNFNPMNNNMMNTNFNNPMNNMNNNMMNPFFIPMNPMMDFNLNFSESVSLEPKNVKRNEGLDVKCDIDRILHSNHELQNKNKDLQTIINFIPFTIIQDEPKKLKDDPSCVICLTNFEVGEKVSALPCCHSFHTKCLDNWITRNPKCPVCKFEVTLRNLIGEDFIKEQLKKIEEEKREKERIEKEKKEK